MIAKVSLGAGAVLLFLPLAVVTGAAFLLVLLAVLWMRGMHALLQRAWPTRSRVSDTHSVPRRRDRRFPSDNGFPPSAV